MFCFRFSTNILPLVTLVSSVSIFSKRNERNSSDNVFSQSPYWPWTYFISAVIDGKIFERLDETHKSFQSEYERPHSRRPHRYSWFTNFNTNLYLQRLRHLLHVYIAFLLLTYGERINPLGLSPCPHSLLQCTDGLRQSGPSFLLYWGRTLLCTLHFLPTSLHLWFIGLEHPFTGW